MSPRLPLRFALSLLAGLLASLAFAPLSLWPLWPLGLAGGLLLARGLGPLAAALLGFGFGLGQHLATLYWSFISTHVYGGAPMWLGALMFIAFSVYLSIYPALVFGVAARARLFEPRAQAWIGFVCLWLASEMARSFVWGGFPWLTAGQIMTGTAFDRLAAVTGVFGLTAVMLSLAFAAFALAQRRAWLGAAAVLPLLPPLLLPAPSSWTQPSGAPLRAVLLQGNVPQDRKWLREMQRPTMDLYERMTREALPADLVVFPEVAITVPLAEVQHGWLRRLGQTAEAGGATALVGISRFEGTVPFNSIAAVGRDPGLYDKRHLVPFGEYFPVPDWVRPIMEAVGTPYGDIGFGAPDQPRIRVRGVPLSLSICFEDVFGDEIAADAREAGLLVNLTNDAWFADSVAPHQHFHIARTRAIETGRPVLRVAQTGISAHIDADGRVVSRTPQFELASLAVEVTPRTGLTPYMRWLNAPIWGLGLIGVLIALWRIFGGRGMLAANERE